MASHSHIRLASPELRSDLATYLGRAARVEDGALRISAITEHVVALWVPVLRPSGILDDSPLVIAVRAIAATIVDGDTADMHNGQFDAVVPLRAMLDRLAREPASDADALMIPLPPERRNEAWAGRRPPIGGWEPVAELDASELTRVAERGIGEIGAQFGDVLGQLRAERARTETWVRQLPPSCLTERFTASTAALPPAGAAFAAHALGFLPLSTSTPVRCSSAPGWWRLAFPAGQVLVRRKDERDTTNH